MGQNAAKSLKDIKSELCANPLEQTYSLNKEATATTDVSEKAIGGVLSQEGEHVIYVSIKLTSAQQSY